MRYKIIVFFSTLLYVLPVSAEKLPDGYYELVAVRCNNNSNLRYAKTVSYKSYHQSMIQAEVQGRPSLSPYFFGMTAQKVAEYWVLYWSQLHTGNATNDERNHQPFYANFISIGRLHTSEIANMALLPESIAIGYLEEDFNNQKFSEQDITGRMAKDKHLGSYTTKVSISAITDPKLPNKMLYEVAELDAGFGAPRHLLCGQVDAKMSYIFSSVKNPFVLYPRNL